MLFARYGLTRDRTESPRMPTWSQSARAHSIPEAGQDNSDIDYPNPSTTERTHLT